jgi:LPXTG-motif cell wall-anchored protein
VSGCGAAQGGYNQPGAVATQCPPASGGLPHTGEDLGLVAAAGLLLVVIGVAVRRVAF